MTGLGHQLHTARLGAGGWVAHCECGYDSVPAASAAAAMETGTDEHFAQLERQARR
ncbi:MAG: hypothetical protein HOV79_00300 [Hamadaea sp.]|nr:hypothetical protein [Hamadaea sp.]